MNKKILIASIFATLMLLVPTTSVVGVSDVEEDCGCDKKTDSGICDDVLNKTIELMYKTDLVKELIQKYKESNNPILHKICRIRLEILIIQINICYWIGRFLKCDWIQPQK